MSLALILHKSNIVIVQYWFAMLTCAKAVEAQLMDIMAYCDIHHSQLRNNLTECRGHNKLMPFYFWGIRDKAYHPAKAITSKTGGSV